jgi:hypothetical protein
VSPRTKKIIAIFLLLLMIPVFGAVLLAIFVHPAFLLLLLTLAFVIPLLRAIKR